jgi:hypothetical protein
LQQPIRKGHIKSDSSLNRNYVNGPQESIFLKSYFSQQPVRKGRVKSDSILNRSSGEKLPSIKSAFSLFKRNMVLQLDIKIKQRKTLVVEKQLQSCNI